MAGITIETLQLRISIYESSPNEHDPDFCVYLDTLIGKVIIYYYIIYKLTSKIILTLYF